MPISKGSPWGRPGRLPDDGVTVSSDADAAQVVSSAIERGEQPPPLGLLGGDLAKTVGATGDRDRLASDDAMALPCDIGEAVIDGVTRLFVAHLVIRRSWLVGDLHAVMNAEFLGSWDVAPRSHPNDGRLDHLHVTGMPLGQRMQARTRLRTGTHIPHPAIAVHRSASMTIPVPHRSRVFLDGVAFGRADEVVIRCLPSRVTVHV